MSSKNEKNGIFKEVKIPETQNISTLLSDKKSLEKCKCSYNTRFGIFKEDINILNTVSQESYVYAIMSSNAYNRKVQIDIPGWKRTKRMINQHGFSADIYVSDDEKRVVIAFRGTDDKNDWKYGNTDIDLDGQYGDADELFKYVLSEYPGKTIMTTGHSLGGGLAMHISLLNKDVDAVVFHPSPRVFANRNYDQYENLITIIYEAGEILTFVRKLFSTLKKIKHQTYRYNFLGGLSVKEHSIEAFARCMYASLHKKESQYEALCKKNTL
ncbi:hypothetical protein YH65_06205 [Sulfurovum lithotrophicum]|uniref:Fungal lipase-like domain-containing protein n=1 Tax=Sulfurovum lithotrophicum TaxID=206403 RepID=A0A7U4M1B1_9BACT|nr:Mbeg1-like protein [Sulfurovum lithotrophicum]AKF25029.1 hypothetical protein YH65_06205 [Sulfurovum lithotrophicum]